MALRAIKPHCPALTIKHVSENKQIHRTVEALHGLEPCTVEENLKNSQNTIFKK
jgi:hypothetical protein